MRDLSTLSTEELTRVFLCEASSPHLHIICRELASRADASAEIFAALSMKKDEATLRNLAKNPSVPMERLLRLLEKYPEEFLQNPLLPMLLLEDPALSQLSAQALFVLAQRDGGLPLLRGPILQRSNEIVGLFSEDEVSSALLEVLSWSPGYWARCRVAAHPSVSCVVLERLALDVDEDVRRQAASREGLSVESMARLARDVSAHVRREVTKNEQLPEECMRALSSDESDEVLASLIEHPRLPAALIEEMFYSERQFSRASFASNPNTPVKMLVELVRRGEHLFELASNPNLSLEGLQLILYEKYNPESPIKVLAALAEHEKTTPEMLREISTRGVYAKRSVAKNPKSPPLVLLELLRDADLETSQNAKETLRRV